MSTYARKDIAFTKGEGVWLWDQNGEKYLDALSGIAVCGLGHAHPKIAEVIAKQASTLLHTSNIYRIPAQEQLGDRLCAISNMDRAFFCNSGAEANEAAIKLARLHGNKQNIEIPTIIVCENSFHGRTMATLTATGNRKAHAGFEPLVAGFIRVPFGDSETVTEICKNNSNVCAIFVEPIQGEGGIHIPSDTYLQELRSICDQHNLLLILDEVQTGNGRTGKWFAYQHQQVLPDVMTTAKGLGNGMPIGACLARGAAAELFGPGSHGSTFGGNPLACVTALQVLATIEEENLLSHAASMGQLLVDTLKQTLSNHLLVKDIRGCGMMIGIELTAPCAIIVDLALQKKLLVNVTADNVIRLLPPLITNRDEITIIANIISECINDFQQQH
jgi:acetylornithine/N-succinyldiaminopimelate aminotransferase